MLPPVIYLLAIGTAALVESCRSNPENQNECFEDTPDGKKPCKPKVIPGPVPVADSDGDGVPDGKDQCPHEAHIGSKDGCAPSLVVIDPKKPIPFCDGDNDNDGIKNCEDQCPDIAGIAQAQGCTDMAYPLNRDYFHLVASQSSVVQPVDTLKPCVHFYPLANHAGTFLWSGGRDLKIRTTSQTNDTILRTAPTGEPDIDLCPLRKAIAVDGRGRNVVLWQQGSAGELAQLFFQRFEANGHPVGDPVAVDSFPMPNLGVRGDVKIATLSLKQNDDAVVVWVHRDKVMLREFPATGEEMPAQLVNIRAITNPRSINPDLALDPYGDMAVVWQEGSDETGRIGGAIYEANRADPDSRFVGLISPQGGSPAVAIAGGLVAYGWEEQGIHLQMQEKKGSIYVGKWTKPAVLSNSTTALHPSVVLDYAERLTLSWLDPQAGTNAYVLKLKEFANYRWAPIQSPVSPMVVDEAVAMPWAPLISTGGVHPSLALFYPNPDRTTWQSLFFDWAGSEAPLPGPVLILEPTAVTIDSGSPAPLHWQNRGVEPLIFIWNLSSGFFIQRGTARLSEGSETLGPATGKVNMLVSDGSTQTGSLTLQTNDPGKSSITIPVRRGP